MNSHTNTVKITAGVAAGFLTIILTWVLRQYVGVQVPEEVGQAFTGIVTFFTGFFQSSPMDQAEKDMNSDRLS